MLADNIQVRDGTLYFAGHNTVQLAQKYGTPLYLMDEARIRENCRMYLRAFRRHFGENARPLYASKAASFKRMYEIMHSEGMGVDVVSAGEIHTAALAGFPMEQAYFHGNNKTDAEIQYAIEQGVGYFVADNHEELDAINRIAGALGKQQRVLLRLTPGIDPHTYEAVATGKVDSKFGAAIETGQAEALFQCARALPNVTLVGFHCHVGSQVFDEDVFERAGQIMLEFVALLRNRYGFATQQLDLGGGYGVRYCESDKQVDIEQRIGEVASSLKASAAALGIPLPTILMEPGRSIVADAGMTLYTVGTVKRIPGYKNYVSVDGGMTDNPRYALYGSAYTVYAAGRMDEPAVLHCDVVGRCCESGDIIQPKVALPDIRRGDLLAVCTTGAYNYSMASNYNRMARPPVVMLTPERDTLAVRRETLEQLTENDI
ncbi:MAG: diaminopimelate decarboxylase [Clostridiales bacterium]|nr:diaminopimelate decarboxylase [Clostridiales bacterium]MDD6935726.1 diaminopimelate decarboxylase [Clostridiales bacterium]MDY2962623.1 diaminopimelate decarboxylase [Oscillospiraceae bacterium]